jgi:hypothetical protein
MGRKKYATSNPGFRYREHATAKKMVCSMTASLPSVKRFSENASKKGWAGPLPRLPQSEPGYQRPSPPGRGLSPWLKNRISQKPGASKKNPKKLPFRKFSPSTTFHQPNGKKSLNPMIGNQAFSINGLNRKSGKSRLKQSRRFRSKKSKKRLGMPAGAPAPSNILSPWCSGFSAMLFGTVSLTGKTRQPVWGSKSR